MSGSLKQRVEALLFATQGLSVKKICETLNCKPKAVVQALESLKDDYSKRDSAFIVTNTNNVWKLTVHSEHVPVVKDLIPSEFPKSVMETLAVIAWKNPVEQSDVVKVRGNKAYNHIKQLEDYELISSSPKGRTKELRLTDRFYEYFNTEPGEVKDKFSKG